GHTGFQPAGDYATDAKLTTVSGDLQTNIDGKSDTGHTHTETDITDLEHDAVKIRGRNISSTDVPANGESITWNESKSEWEYTMVSGGGESPDQDISLIGVAGTAGFGVGICPSQLLPAEMTPLAGYDEPTHDNYGNYQYEDGSIMCWIPKFYYLIASGTNTVTIKGIDTYVNEAAANADNYALHRAFIDGGTEQQGFFFDKYQCSKKGWGSGQIASSIKNGLPISINSAHNPIADLTACVSNYHWQTINAAHARDGVDGAVNSSSIFHCASKFQYAALALLSLAHGQACSATTYCAWYDATYNYPKGCNNDALKDYDEVSNGAGSGDDLLYTTDGYSNCGKTGSGVPFAKSTHNGQNCGVADLNGLMWEVSLGVTRDATAFYVAKEATAMKDFTSGNSVATDHWGSTGIAAMMTSLTVPYITGNDGWIYYGNGANQVLSGDLSGNAWLLTGLSLPKDSNGLSAAGTNQFGKDGLYRYLRDELCLISCGLWDFDSDAGVWLVAWSNDRTYSGDSVGFRAACYPE
ncbi:MAG: hypothetical protein JRJ85_00645, partial [Deltaproteobacteria bacterium]|nr:hypothetical protein [Deltaproteobacteria bacterium]